MKKRTNVASVIATLQRTTTKYPPLLIDVIIQEFGHDPFLIVIACLLSLRAKDSATIVVCRTLFSLIKTPQELLALPVKNLESIIHPIGFFRKKAETLRSVSQTLCNDFGGHVPHSEKELLSIKGIGRKTAMLVLAKAFGQATICVDVHVHRISNRLGLVCTKNPYDTEKALEKIIPKKHWSMWNTWLVLWGQHICLPIRPRCSQCALLRWCHQCEVTKNR